MPAHTYTSVPDHVVALLAAHVPRSLPLLRWLQWARYRENGAPRPGARTVVVVDESGQRFTAAHVDFAGGPDTQMWLYSTLEDGIEGDVCDYASQIDELTREILRAGRSCGASKLCYPSALLLGTLATPVRRVLEGMERITGRETGYYDKWLFRATDLPARDFELPPGMRWDTATLEDCRVVMSRTDIPRTAELLAELPSLVIRLDDGTPISWAFLGVDGALSSLHCEEPYRRRGLAKALAAKLQAQGMGEFAHDGWSSADVAADNVGSRAICRSLNGSPEWEVSWVLFHVPECTQPS